MIDVGIMTQGKELSLRFRDAFITDGPCLRWNIHVSEASPDIFFIVRADVDIGVAKLQLPIENRIVGRSFADPFQRRRLRRGDIGRVLSARGFYGWSGPTWSAAFYQPGGGAIRRSCAASYARLGRSWIEGRQAAEPVLR